MDYKNITYYVEDRLGYITLKRKAKRNALSGSMVLELTDAFKSAEAAENVNVIILNADGRVFSSGADLEHMKGLQRNSFEENLEDSKLLVDLFKTIYLNKKIVIAQVEGHAIAGGCGLASICDFCFAVPEANFGYTEAKIGFIPAAVMIFLIRKIGEGRAKAMLLSGRLINADEAKAIGLINEVIDPRDMEIFTRKFARRLIRDNSSASLEATKLMIAEVQDLSLDKALELAAKRSAEVRQHPDCKKGIASFLDKKIIKW